MSNDQRMTDLSGFGARRRNRAATGTAALQETRQRAAITERRLPQVPAGSLPGLSGANASTTTLLTEDQRRRAASYSIPAAELKCRSADALRAAISPEVAEIARRHRLNLLATRVLETIHRAQKASSGGQDGRVYISLSPASVADILNAAPEQGPNRISADQVRDLITALTKLGALNQKPGFGPGVATTYSVNA
jgi:hypothetical protein